jgi:hypothetical protein
MLESARGDTNASVLGLPYWTEFNRMRDARKLLPRFENAGPRFFLRYFLVNPSQKTGFRNIHYEGRIRIRGPQVNMRLIFKRAADIKEMFDLITQDRDRIEEEVGFRLQWLRESGLGAGSGSPILPSSETTWTLVMRQDGSDSTYGF